MFVLILSSSSPPLPSNLSTCFSLSGSLFICLFLNSPSVVFELINLKFLPNIFRYLFSSFYFTVYLSVSKQSYCASASECVTFYCFSSICLFVFYDEWNLAWIARITIARLQMPQKYPKILWNEIVEVGFHSQAQIWKADYDAADAAFGDQKCFDLACYFLGSVAPVRYNCGKNKF